MTTTPAVSVQALTKRYGKTVALDGLTVTLDYGSITALLGPNGAGKTTTFKCLLGITGFAGDILIGGLSVLKEGREARRRIGYIPQTPAFDAADTAEGTLEFLAQLKGAEPERVRTLLERVNLANEARMKVGELSGGMRQRLALAAALLSDPPVLLLDEPTANLDHESRRQLNDLLIELRDDGKCILLSTHFLESVSGLAQRYLLLEHGRLVLDITSEELASRSQRRRWVVDTNGTAPESFQSALASVGIEWDHVSREEPDLEIALARELESRRGREETD
jgi:ABC-type multidrug transport system ATPase subunit